MPDVSNEICPGDAVRGLDEPGVGDRAEGLADVGGVGYVAVGAEEDGAEAGGIGGVAEVGVGGVGGAVGGWRLELEDREVWGGRRKLSRERRKDGKDVRSVVERFHEGVIVVDNLLELVRELFSREGVGFWWRASRDSGGLVGA